MKLNSFWSIYKMKCLVKKKIKKKNSKILQLNNLKKLSLLHQNQNEKYLKNFYFIYESYKKKLSYLAKRFFFTMRK